MELSPFVEERRVELACPLEAEEFELTDVTESRFEGDSVVVGDDGSALLELFL